MGQCCLVGLRAKSLYVGKMPAQDRALVFDFFFFFSCVGTKAPPAAKMPWG